MINRYDVTGKSGRGGVIFAKEVKTIRGDYVRFEDHRDLVDALKEEVRSLENTVMEMNE